MEKLTQKQQRVYDYIRETLAVWQTPPTRAEIAQALGFASVNAAQVHLRTLERKGAIELNAHRSRGIRVLGDRSHDDIAEGHNGELTLAVVGRVAAGAPMLAVAHVERHCRVDASVFSARPDYLLRVRGDSMTGAGILDGDLLAIRTVTEINAGQIAVFRWDDEVTVKRFRRRGAQAVLIAENPDYADIVIDTRRENLSVEGVAVGVIRAL